MARTDHYDDAAAPRPNSVVPAASGAVFDDQGRILLVHRVDNELWALPGGTHEIGETIEGTAVREVREETGLTVAVTRLSGVYTDPRHVIAYTDGEVRQEFSLVFLMEVLGGDLRRDRESKEVRFVSCADVDGLAMHASMRRRVENAFESGADPFLG
jgi:ADP-ribose pyrophosphatase YjhB (NUDIX family)